MSIVPFWCVFIIRTEISMNDNFLNDLIDRYYRNNYFLYEQVLILEWIKKNSDSGGLEKVMKNHWDNINTDEIPDLINSEEIFRKISENIK